ncbi:MAG: hypothetical protein RML93_02740 [Anaerolineales bacterium]|nr:hypothetical protein [Anaerolineales bacterium]MDW8446191.1 hypothetical protein [Anaerolineales bacterium]
MSTQKWLILHAALLIAAGVVFLLYSPLVITGLGFDQLVQDSEGYWAMVSFARLFGVALTAWGLTILGGERFASAVQSAEGASLRGILGAVTVGDFLGAFSAAIQAASVWGLPSSWSLSLGFTLLGAISLWVLWRQSKLGRKD